MLQGKGRGGGGVWGSGEAESEGGGLVKSEWVVIMEGVSINSIRIRIENLNFYYQI